MSKIYDVIILGAGPAGLAAGLYAGRARTAVRLPSPTRLKTIPVKAWKKRAAPR